MRTFFKKIISRSIVVRFFVFSLFSLGCAQGVYAANIILSPTSASYGVGTTFSVTVSISNNSEAINGVSGIVSFSSDSLELTSISKSGSIIAMWAEEPTFSNATGRASFEGVIFNPGFSGSQGKVLTLNFKVKKAGTGIVQLLSGSVLANDGNATNVLGTLGEASFSLSGAQVKDTTVTTTSSYASKPVVTSSSYPDNTKWYKSHEASFEWVVPSSVTAVRTLYNETENSTPNKVYDPPINNRSFTVDGNGVMYMHVQFRSGGAWGTVSSYKFQVDSDAPESIKASFPDGTVTSNPTPAILVIAQDSLSGIDRITMSIDGSDPISYVVDPSNLYRLPKQLSGKHTVVVSALDKAGNTSSITLDYTIQAITIPVITEYTKNVELGGTLRIIGTTYPETIVEITLTDKDGKSEIETTTADSNGIFSLSWSKKTGTGIYEMKARSINQKGAMSDHTEEKTIVIENIPLIRFGIFIMNWLSLILILIIAIVATIATFWFSFIQFGRFRRKVRRTMLEAEHTLKVNVQALRRDTEEFHTLLVKVERKRKLTKEEQTMLKKFKKRLDIVEKEIEEKLEAIG